jgi:hypothetical protein
VTSGSLSFLSGVSSVYTRDAEGPAVKGSGNTVNPVKTFLKIPRKSDFSSAKFLKKGRAEKFHFLNFFVNL